MKDVFRYGGAGVGLAAALLANRLMGNKSVKSNVIAALIGGAAGYGGGHYLYNYILDNSDVGKAYNRVSQDNPGEMVYVDPTNGETKTIPHEDFYKGMINYANAYKGSPEDKAKATSDWIANTFGISVDPRSVMAMHNEYLVRSRIEKGIQEYQKDPNSVVSDAPLGSLGADSTDVQGHNSRLDQFDRFLSGEHKTAAWSAGGYKHTGLSRDAFNKAKAQWGIQSDNQFAAILIYSRLCKDYGSHSILAQHYGNNKPLKPVEVDYLAYNAMPRSLRGVLPVGHRRIATERAAISNGWSREIDEEMWSHPEEFKHRVKLVNLSDNLSTMGYGIGIAATGGSGWFMLPMMADGGVRAVITGTLPQYDANTHQRGISLDPSSWLNNHRRHMAVNMLIDPRQAPQYATLNSTVRGLNTADRFALGTDALDLALDTYSWIKGNTNLTSFLFQTAMNSFYAHDRLSAVAGRKPQIYNPLSNGGNAGVADLSGYRGLWVNQVFRKPNTYDFNME